MSSPRKGGLYKQKGIAEKAAKQYSEWKKHEEYHYNPLTGFFSTVDDGLFKQESYITQRIAKKNEMQQEVSAIYRCIAFKYLFVFFICIRLNIYESKEKTD